MFKTISLFLFKKRDVVKQHISSCRKEKNCNETIISSMYFPIDLRRFPKYNGQWYLYTELSEVSRMLEKFYGDCRGFTNPSNSLRRLPKQHKSDEYHACRYTRERFYEELIFKTDTLDSVQLKLQSTVIFCPCTQ